MFHTFMPKQGKISGIGGTSEKFLGQGTVILNSNVDGKVIPLTLQDVIYAPGAGNCLLSGSQIDLASGHLSYGNQRVTIYDPAGKINGQGKLVLGTQLYLMDARARLYPERPHLAVPEKSFTWDELHLSYGHLGMSGLQDHVKSGTVTGLNIDTNSKPSLTCKACIQAKAAHTPIPKVSSSKRAKDIGTGWEEEYLDTISL